MAIKGRFYLEFPNCPNFSGQQYKKRPLRNNPPTPSYWSRQTQALLWRRKECFMQSLQTSSIHLWWKLGEISVYSVPIYLRFDLSRKHKESALQQKNSRKIPCNSLKKEKLPLSELFREAASCGFISISIANGSLVFQKILSFPSTKVVQIE